MGTFASTTLAIDCATEFCSVALFDGERLVAGTCEKLGRGHAERLVPMIAELPGKGRAARIMVALGPGSFTGVRIGLAAARALGLVWGAEVLGYPTLTLVAAMARQAFPKAPVSVVMEAGHGEWFVQDHDADGLPQTDVRSLPPALAARAATHRLLAGTRATDLAALTPTAEREVVQLHPDARQAMLLAPEALTGDLAPIYGRPPDARLPARKP